MRPDAIRISGEASLPCHGRNATVRRLCYGRTEVTAFVVSGIGNPFLLPSADVVRRTDDGHGLGLLTGPAPGRLARGAPTSPACGGAGWTA